MSITLSLLIRTAIAEEPAVPDPDPVPVDPPPEVEAVESELEQTRAAAQAAEAALDASDAFVAALSVLQVGDATEEARIAAVRTLGQLADPRALLAGRRDLRSPG
jgi:hypothetical protein